MKKILPRFDLADAIAVKAVASGTADEVQQRRAMEWILNGLCRIRDLSYTESPRDTDFNEGRRFVGLEIAMYWQTSVETLKQLSTKRRGGRNAI